jgi:hypothetical protein
MSNNISIAKTQISDLIRVSSAAIFYNYQNTYYQYETWVFSDDARQPSRQIIHGTDTVLNDRLLTKTKVIHDFVSDELKEKFSNS